MDPKSLKVSGTVRRGRVDVGSKSERDALLLDAAGGKSYVLRRQGGPAMGADATLDGLVGRSIEAEGFDLGSTLIMKDWATKD